MDGKRSVERKVVIPSYTALINHEASKLQSFTNRQREQASSHGLETRGAWPWVSHALTVDVDELLKL
jgi:hypothetical protein